MERSVSGPIVRDIVKAYYDKKNKKTQGQVTAGNQPPQLRKNEASPATEAPKALTKAEQSAAVVPGDSAKKPRPN